jgi:hypothetical protein
MNQERRASNPGFLVGVIIAALVVAGGITILVLYPVSDRTSFYIAVAAIVLSPIFVLVAFVVNKIQRIS